MLPLLVTPGPGLHDRTAAASFVPSADEVIAPQAFQDPTEVSSVHVSPESDDLQMLPKKTAAASFVPSDDEVIAFQFLADPKKVSSVQVKCACAMHTAVRERNLLDSFLSRPDVGRRAAQWVRHCFLCARRVYRVYRASSQPAKGRVQSPESMKG